MLLGLYETILLSVLGRELMAMPRGARRLHCHRTTVLPRLACVSRRLVFPSRNFGFP